MGVPPAFLQGYAFIGPDLIIGAQGQKEYGNVPTGGDGAYVSVTNETTGRARIGTDAAGYARLFIYEHGTHWAVGTSLIELGEYAHAQGWQLSVDTLELKIPLLARRVIKPSLLAPRMMSQQMMSRSTGFKEISLLLPDEEVILKGARNPSVTITRRETVLPDGSYADVLEAALNEMTGRLRTLIHGNLPVVSDISGGRDSRTVLAGLMAANDTGESIGSVVRFRSGESVERDWKIVEPLARKYQLDVNRSPVEKSIRVNPAYGYKVWRRHDLGVYFPLYPHSHARRSVALSGAAGGVHRSVYPERSIRDNVLALKTDQITSEEINQLADRVEDTLSSIDNGLDPNLEHFRLFRNRLHGGRNSLRSLSLAPLGSERLKLASSMLSPKHLARAQFYADVMLNLAPDLAAEPYDDAKKGWDTKHHEELTRVNVDPSQREGKVYGEFEYEQAHTDAPKRSPLEPYREVFEDASRVVIDNGLLPPDYVHAAGVELHGSANSRLAHAINGAAVSAVIFAGQATELSQAESVSPKSFFERWFRKTEKQTVSQFVGS